MALYVVDYQGNPKKPYKLIKRISYKSTTYGKWVIVPFGRRSDGATGAVDLIDSDVFWIHDELCDQGEFEDGTKCTNWMCSTVLSEVLKRDGHWIRARYWFVATFLFGGGKARENGMW